MSGSVGVRHPRRRSAPVNGVAQPHLSGHTGRSCCRGRRVRFAPCSSRRLAPSGEPRQELDRPSQQRPQRGLTRRSHQVRTRAAPTWTAVACGVIACAWLMDMPGMANAVLGRVASKARRRPPRVARVPPPMPVNERSRPPSRKAIAKICRTAATCTHTGGAAPMASACPPAAGSTHSAANTTARKLRTAGDALTFAGAAGRPEEISLARACASPFTYCLVNPACFGHRHRRQGQVVLPARSACRRARRAGGRLRSASSRAIAT